jgi:hypothetical protein
VGVTVEVSVGVPVGVIVSVTVGLGVKDAVEVGVKVEDEVGVDVGSMGASVRVAAGVTAGGTEMHPARRTAASRLNPERQADPFFFV